MTVDKLANWTIVISMPFLIALAGYNLTRSPNSDRNRDIENKLKAAPLAISSDASGGDTIGIFLSPQCHFCTESAPTYKKLLNASQESKVRVVGIFQEPESIARAYTAGLGYELHRYIAMDSIGLKERVPTPTMVLLSSTGVVKRVWIGRPSTEVEKEVLDIATGRNRISLSR